MRKFKKSMRVLLVLSLAMSLIFGNFTAFANIGIAVEVNGQRVIFTDQQPVIVDGRTLVPVRGVFEMLGYNVGWDGSTQTATLSNGVNTIMVTLGSPVVITNGRAYNLDVPAQMINGRTMLPLRAVVESVGYSLDWDGGTQTIRISSSGSTAWTTAPQTIQASQINNAFFEGRWVSQGQGSRTFLDFRADGTFTAETVVEHAISNAPMRIGTFTINAQNNIVLADVPNVRGEYRVINNGMSIEIVHPSFEIRFDRVDAHENEQTPATTPPPQAIQASQIHGTWRNARRNAQNNAVFTNITFSTDNTFHIHESDAGQVFDQNIRDRESRGNFALSGNNLTLTHNNGSVRTYTLTISNDRIFLQSGSTSFEFRVRLEGFAQMAVDAEWLQEITTASTGMYIPQGTHAPPQATTTTAPSENSFVGVWRYFGSTATNGFHLVINADGTYAEYNFWGVDGLLHFTMQGTYEINANGNIFLTQDRATAILGSPYHFFGPSRFFGEFSLQENGEQLRFGRTVDRFYRIASLPETVWAVDPATSPPPYAPTTPTPAPIHPPQQPTPPDTPPLQPPANNNNAAERERIQSEIDNAEHQIRLLEIRRETEQYALESNRRMRDMQIQMGQSTAQTDRFIRDGTARIANIDRDINTWQQRIRDWQAQLNQLQ